MLTLDFERAIIGRVSIDFCFPCQLIWFDGHEATELSPGGLLILKGFGSFAYELPSPGRPPDTPRGLILVVTSVPSTTTTPANDAMDACHPPCTAALASRRECRASVVYWSRFML